MPLLDEENIIKILKNNDYFQETNENFNLVVNEIIYISVSKDMKIYDNNDLSNFFFIMNKGTVNLIKKESSKQLNTHHKNKENHEKNNLDKNNNKNYGPWESFGDISFYNGKQRLETMIATENVELYAIDCESFRELLKRNNEIILKEKYNFLNNISIFESLDKISKYNVAQKLKKKEFPSNTKIIKRGEVGDTLYIIKEGIVSCKIGVK
jgi:cAMP-dependent protein kinase regulator